ncbi:MAG: hypothetical protein ABTD50_18375 [Polyangiaceae bacterium]
MSARRRPYVAAVAFVVVAVVFPRRVASADPVLVLIAEPTGGTPVSTEVANRVRGELIADGFHVELGPSVPDADRTGALRRAGRAGGAAIVAGLFVDDNTGRIDMYLLNTFSDGVVARRVEAPTRSPDEGPQVVARHAVTLLRATLLDFVVEGLRSAFAAPPKPPSRLSSPAAPPPSQSRDDASERRPSPRLAVEGGLGVMGGFGGVGPAVMPVLRFRLAATENLQVRLMGAGLGAAPSLQAQTGSATVQQDLVQLDAIVSAGRGRWPRPLAGVGVGAYYAGVTGSGTLPYQGHDDSALTLAVAGAVGLGATIARDVDLSLELQALVAEPGVVVRFADATAARLGRPLLFATFTVTGWM